MADHNPTGSGTAVALKLPADHVRFLRETLEDALDGVKDELDNAKRPGDPDRLRREKAAYGRLLTGLEELVIVPNDQVREVVVGLAQIIDASNEYERVVLEHEALTNLIDQTHGVGR